MEQQSTIKPWQWILTIIVVIALIVVVYFMVRGGSSTNNPPVTDVNTETPATTTGPRFSSLSVNDQFPGNVVFLTSVSITKPGFAVVRESLAGGKAGDVLGTLYFATAGTYPGKVLLSKPTIDGKTYIAELHEDDSDKLFNAAKDVYLNDSLGKPVMKTFKATSQITEVKG